MYGNESSVDNYVIRHAVAASVNVIMPLVTNTWIYYCTISFLGPQLPHYNERWTYVAKHLQEHNTKLSNGD